MTVTATPPKDGPLTLLVKRALLVGLAGALIGAAEGTGLGLLVTSADGAPAAVAACAASQALAFGVLGVGLGALTGGIGLLCTAVLGRSRRTTVSSSPAVNPTE